MPSLNFRLNGEPIRLDVEDDVPLLYVLRNDLGLVGSRFGCGTGQCGACTVLMDGHPVRSCVFRASHAAGKRVRTIEGPPDRVLRALQNAWVAEQVPQCGYCQSGMLMAAYGLLNFHPEPTDEDIALLMTNLCRCGTYSRVRAAIQRAARALQGDRA